MAVYDFGSGFKISQVSDLEKVVRDLPSLRGRRSYGVTHAGGGGMAAGGARHRQCSCIKREVESKSEKPMKEEDEGWRLMEKWLDGKDEEEDTPTENGFWIKPKCVWKGGLLPMDEVMERGERCIKVLESLCDRTGLLMITTSDFAKQMLKAENGTRTEEDRSLVLDFLGDYRGTLGELHDIRVGSLEEQIKILHLALEQARYMVSEHLVCGGCMGK